MCASGAFNRGNQLNYPEGFIMGKWMDGYLEKLAANRRDNLEAGGPQRIELQHQLGKLTARERIDRLADPGTFEEIGSLVREFRMGLEGEPKPSPSDGVIMGVARIHGRSVMVYSLSCSTMARSTSSRSRPFRSRTHSSALPAHIRE